MANFSFKVFFKILTNKFLKICVILILTANLVQAAEAQDNVYNFLVGKHKIDYHKLFDDVIERVKQDYVDEVSDEKLIEAALQGMLSALDPHSGFLNQKEFQEIKISMKGEFGGLGIEITMEKGFLKVISPYEDGPAFKAGIKVGDYITVVNDQIIKGLSLSQAAEKLRGKSKSKVKITIYRESTGETIEMNLMRDIIRIVPVKAKIISNNVALIRISNFSESTAALLKKEFFKLVDQSRESKNEIKGVILDLRWNPGGMLDQAKEVTELFFEEGVVVITKGRTPSANKVYKASGLDITEGLPMVILINGGSASAAEIVAGALQDNKRAMLVGTRSYGKGSVQTVQPMESGLVATKITTSRYYTPSGRSIQAQGIEPDVVVEEAVITSIKGSEFNNEAALIGHLNAEDGKDNNGSNTKQILIAPSNKTSQTNTVKVLSNNRANLTVKETEDFQLLRAIDMVKGMALYSEQRLSN